MVKFSESVIIKIHLTLLIYLYMGAKPCGNTDGEAAQVVTQTIQLVLHVLHGEGSLLGCCDHLPQGHSGHLTHVTPAQQTNNDRECVFVKAFNRIISNIHYNQYAVPR